MSIDKKRLLGTYDPSRDAKIVPLQADIPDPPNYLSAAPRAVELYYQICGFLHDYKVFGQIDYLAVSSLSWWAHHYEQAATMVEKQGPVQTFESGATNVTGWFTAMEKADTKMMVYLKQLGLTPAARHGIRSFMDKKPKRADKQDPFSPK